jgi:hypothetical protein
LLLAIRIAVLASALWAGIALLAQVWAARSGGRRDYSRRAGSPRRGVTYSFTTAMLPAHKESVKLHPVEFGLGVVLHAGVFAALAQVAATAIAPAASGKWHFVMTPLAVIGLAAGLTLLVRRAHSVELRAINVPDDYLANAATCGLLALAAVAPLLGELPLLTYAVLLLVYLPLGKLRHCVFFFVARGDFGRRLGYRGVYPPAPAGTE